MTFKNPDYLKFLPLETDRLFLRLYDPSCLSKIYEAVADSREHLAGTMSWNPLTSTQASLKEFHEHAKAETLQGQKLELLMEQKQDGLFVGQVGSGCFHHDRREAEVGYWIKASCSRRGFTTEAVQCLSNFLFEHVGMNRLFASVLPDNLRSQGVLRKAGFVLTNETKPLLEPVSRRTHTTLVFERKRGLGDTQ